MKKFFFLFFLISLTYWLFSQISTGEEPVSFTEVLSNNIENVYIDSPDIEKLIKEDIENFEYNRVGVLLKINKSIDNAGTWERLDDGSYVWRLKFIADGALALNPYFDKFYLPKGAKLFVYDENGEQVKGAFTHKNNSAIGNFAIELIYGESFILEYYEPKGVVEEPIMEISEINYVYRGLPSYGTDGVGSSDWCEVNINCSPEGDDWQDEKRGVAKLLMKVNGSTYKCSGSLVNNTNQDTIPYLLTADHCAHHGAYPTPAELNQWIFHFNYEYWGCQNPQNDPGSQTLLGASKVANGGDQGSTGSDFYLLRLNDDIPEWYHPYYNGWLAKDSTSLSGVAIHHPEGDIKKISTYNQELITTGWSGSLPSHWKVFWSETEHNWGVTEPGSSGCPLFNSDGKIIGTLTGGAAACDSLTGFDKFGKFSYHWDENGTSDTLRLKPWLDPLGLGVDELDGLDVTTGIVSTAIEKIGLKPNPVKDILWITKSKYSPIEKVQIVDIYGRLFIELEPRVNEIQFSINVADLPKGFYLVRLFCEDGRSLEEKFCKL